MKRILFVDDEPMLLEVIEARFYERAGSWEMDFAEAGDAALRLVTDRSYDVVVSDMRMPGMDGVELLAQVKELQPRARRIMMTGLTDRGQTQRDPEAVHRYVAKPCDFEELELAIDQELELHRGQSR